MQFDEDSKTPDIVLITQMILKTSPHKNAVHIMLIIIAFAISKMSAQAEFY